MEVIASTHNHHQLLLWATKFFTRIYICSITFQIPDVVPMIDGKSYAFPNEESIEHNGTSTIHVESHMESIACNVSTV